MLREIEMKRQPKTNLAELTLKSRGDWTKWSVQEVSSLGSGETMKEVEGKLESKWRQHILDLLLPSFSECPNFVKVGHNVVELHDLFGSLRLRPFKVMAVDSRT